jgi:hypothetical protein
MQSAVLIINSFPRLFTMALWAALYPHDPYQARGFFSLFRNTRAMLCNSCGMRYIPFIRANPLANQVVAAMPHDPHMAR